MLKISKKNICNSIFFLFIVGITFYLLLKDQEIPLIVTSIRTKNDKKIMVIVFLATLLQRIALFSVTYFVYRAFGLFEYGVVDIIALQSIISIAVDMLPLPGGIGVSENLFLIIFKKIFKGSLIMPGMLLSRGISYYGLLIISAVVTLVVQIRYSYRKDRIE